MIKVYLDKIRLNGNKYKYKKHIYNFIYQIKIHVIVCLV